MKLKFIFLLIVLALTSCKPASVSMIDGFYENGNPLRINYYSSIDQSQLFKKELYYENGQLKLQGNYKNNRKHGQWLHYFENGIKSDECWFIEGLLHGRSISFFKNGKLRSSGYFQKGERTRLWTFFDENGKLIKKTNFNLKNNSRFLDIDLLKKNFLSTIKSLGID